MSNFVSRLQKLNLPAESFVVVGSGLLDVLGLRDTDDVDIVMNEEFFNELQAGGWHRNEAHGESYFTKGEYEAWLSWDSSNGAPNFSELYSDNNVISGYHFVSLDRLLAWKLKRARPKDLQDIQLIERYIAEQN